MQSADPDYQWYWEQGVSWDRYLSEEIQKHRPLWEGVYRKSSVPGWAVETARALGGPVNLLVLTEDWCGDAANTVPVIARLAEVVPHIELRLLKRDEHPELMDGYLTAGARSIPLAIALDSDFSPLGRWGPRPRELQEFVLREKRAGIRPSADIYRDTRTWYARDRGASTLRELLDAMHPHRQASDTTSTL
jgi:hypothetical protein